MLWVDGIPLLHRTNVELTLNVAGLRINSRVLARLHNQAVFPCPGIISIDQVVPQLVVAFITCIHFHHLTTSDVPHNVLQPGN